MKVKKQHRVIIGAIISLVILVGILLQTNSKANNTEVRQVSDQYQEITRHRSPKETIEQPEKIAPTYEEQIDALGDVPEGYIVLQDVDGTVSYISEEEYNQLLNQDVRENTVADENADPIDVFEDIEIEIMPADDMVWHQITAYPLDEINGDDIYQSRGQFIYFVQKAIPTLYAQSILAADFDTNTYVMEITLNNQSTFSLPDDFEKRMALAYKNSGYGVSAPNQLTIDYTSMDIDEFLENHY